MNNDETTLTELRKISAWADLQRKMTKGSLIFVAGFIPALIACAVLEKRRENTGVGSVTSGVTPDWSSVDQSVRLGDFDEVIQIGERLMQKTPRYPEAYRRSAGAYLAAGNIEEAKSHYEEAFRPFPSEKNEKLVVAIGKRSKAGNPQPDGAVNGNQPTRSETNRTSVAAGSDR